MGLCSLALAFMSCSGSRAGRAEYAVRSIGPAVLNGGFSTFLAILLLANSQSHAFKSFFKVCTHVISRISHEQTVSIFWAVFMKRVIYLKLNYVHFYAQIFTVVICFGLFHGLVFLPVLLTLIGPQPFSNTQDGKNEPGSGTSPKPPVELRPLTNGNANHSHNNHHYQQPESLAADSSCPQEELLPMDPLNSITVQS